MYTTRPSYPRRILRALWRYSPVIALALATCGAVLAYLSGTGYTAAISAASSPVSSASPSNAKHFKTGETVTAGGAWVVTINSVSLHDPTILDRPNAGATYLIIDTSFKNVSPRAQILSSSLQTSLESPGGQAYAQTIVTFSSSSPDGDIAAGDLARGQLVYEIPQGRKAFTFAFQPDIMNSGRVVWDINV